jgi:hypothetical protein
MLNVRRWLFLSVALNVMLAAGLLWIAGRPEKPDPGRGAVGNGPTDPATRVSAETALAGGLDGGASGKSAADWPRWVDSLHKLGIPNRAIASMVLADFERRWEQRQNELQRRYDTGEIDAAVLARDRSGYEREQERELRQALGDEGFRQWEKENLLRSYAQVEPALNAEETELLYRVQKDIAQKRRDLDDAHSRGEIDSEMYEERAMALSTEQSDQTKKVIGENRLNKFHVEVDPIEAEMRRVTRRLNLPITQVDALVDIEQARGIMEEDLNAQLAKNPDLPEASVEARRLAIAAARDQAYESILGKNGFNSWQMSTDSRYETLRRFAPGWQLGDADVSRVYAAIQQQDQLTRERRLQALADERSGRPVDWAAVQNDLDALKAQTEQSLSASLGAERIARLKRNGVLSSQ